MPITSSYGFPGSATYSQDLGSLDQIMSTLPDNTINQISAKNVRDSAFTMYNIIQSSIGDNTSLQKVTSIGATSNIPVTLTATLSVDSISGIYQAYGSTAINIASPLVFNTGNGFGFYDKQGYYYPNSRTMNAVYGKIYMDTNSARLTYVEYEGSIYCTNGNYFRTTKGSIAAYQYGNISVGSHTYSNSWYHWSGSSGSAILATVSTQAIITDLYLITNNTEGSITIAATCTNAADVTTSIYFRTQTAYT